MKYAILFFLLANAAGAAESKVFIQCGGPGEPISEGIFSFPNFSECEDSGNILKCPAVLLHFGTVDYLATRFEMKNRQKRPGPGYLKYAPAEVVQMSLFNKAGTMISLPLNPSQDGISFSLAGTFSSYSFGGDTPLICKIQNAENRE